MLSTYPSPLNDGALKCVIILKVSPGMTMGGHARREINLDDEKNVLIM